MYNGRKEGIMFRWITGNADVAIVTFNQGNLTLNQNARVYFENCHYVLVGINDEMKLGIKPVLKRDVELNVYDKEDLHKISLGKGYAKINNKLLLDLIAKTVGIPLNGQKLPARYDIEEGILIVDMTQLTEEGGLQ